MQNNWRNKEASVFTVIDAFNQFWQVWEVADRGTLTYIGLYFYIVKRWNVCGRPNVVRLQNTMVCAELGISKPTLDRARNWLKQNGLIEFFSKGKGDSNISYQILEVNIQTVGEVKKSKNVTSPVTSPVTSDEPINKEEELYIVVGGEVKKFNYLIDLFSVDPGLKMRWHQLGLAEKNLSDGIQAWMILNHKKKYEDLHAARKHLLFWLPSYLTHQTNGNGRTQGYNTQGAATGARSSARKGGTITELQSLKQPPDSTTGANSAARSAPDGDS